MPDLPGHGESRALSVLGLEETGAWVLELLDRNVGREPVHIVGSSFGGLIALHLLGVAPERIKTALVSGTAAGLGRGLGALAKVSAVLYALPPELLIRLSNVQFGIPKPYRQGFRDDLRYTANAAFSRKITEVMMAFRLPTAAEVPVLAAVGQRETVAAKRAARKIVASLPSAQGVLVPKMGHVWNLQAPDLFAATVRAWTTRTPLPGELRPLSGR